MHGNVQRVGGHHGRDSSQTGCATPITADALTGRNTGCRTTPGWSHSRGTVRRIRGGGIAARMARPAPAVGRQHGGRRHAVDATTRPVLHNSCGATAPTRLSSGTRAGSRAAPARRRLAAAWSGRCCPRTRDVAASRCRGLADRRDTSRPPRCRTGCRSGAAADARRTPRRAQRAAGGQARQHEASAQARARMRRDAGCAGNGGWKRHGSVLPVSQAACRSAVYSGSGGVQRAGWRACASTRARQRRARCPAPRWRRCTPAPRAPGSPLRRGAASAPRLHAGDALRCIQRRASLHHHELPTHSAVVVGLPADTAQHGARQEHRATAPAVELVRARRFAEAQVELEAWFDVGKRHARQRRAGRLAGKCSRSAPAAGEADAVMVRSPAVLWKLPLQQATQQVGHGHALREGRHLDACPHRGCDVEGQAGGVEVALAQRIGIALANPRLGVWIRGRTCADADALDRAFAVRWRLRCHVGHRNSSSTSAVISRAAVLSGAVSRASRPAATLSANTMR